MHAYKLSSSLLLPILLLPLTTAGQLHIEVTAAHGIKNHVQLTDDLATSGQPTQAQFTNIAEEGYAAVINLAVPDSESAIGNEGSIVAGLGMSYVNIPVDFTNPTIDDLRLFINTLQALEGKKVWVHCALNARASAFAYHYLKHFRSLSEAAARSPILDLWQPRIQPVWQEFLQLSKEDIGL